MFTTANESKVNLMQSIDKLTLDTVCNYVINPEREEIAADESFSVYLQYSIEWIVNITEGHLIADAIADRHGFINNGLVSAFA